MTKSLYIVRHGKSTWDYNSASDIDRPLKERGIKDAYHMSERLLKNNQVPELIISSTAVRAMHTATIFARTFELDTSKIQLNNNLYLASTRSVLDIVESINDQINSVMIFGHNPTFTDLANIFLKDKIDNMPTTGLAKIIFNSKTWTNIRNQEPIESFFDYPKNII